MLPYLSLILIAVAYLNNVLVSDLTQNLYFPQNALLLHWLNQLILLVDLHCEEFISLFLSAYANYCICTAS